LNEVGVFSNPCPLCKKREATRLCDYIIRYDNSIIFFRNRQLFNKVNSPCYKHETCDLPMCEECSHSVGVNVDFCPHHYKLHLQVELPEKLRKYQWRSQASMYEEDKYEEGEEST